MLGSLLSVISAACFGLNNATVRRGVVTGSVIQGLIISVPSGVPLFFVCTLLAGSLDLVLGFSTETLLLFAAAGVVHFVFGRYCNYRALKAMGANLTGPVQQCTLIVSLGGAMWFLNEYLTPLRIIGIILVFLGPAVMLNGRKSSPAKPRSASEFQPKYVEGFTFSILSTVAYGSSPLFIRAVFEHGGGTGIGASLAGGLVSYIAATIVAVLFVLRKSQIDHILATDRAAVPWFVWSGVNVCAAQIFRYMALAVAPVSVVAPLMQLQVIFRWIFAWMINREHEVFDKWALIGTAISLVGALALSLSIDFVLNLIPLPATLVEIARWRWP
jgi:drug/metabolite transporter (DMT)-like permease